MYNNSMQIDIITIFPNMFTGILSSSIIKRAQDKDKVQINIHNLRDWATDNHHSVDAPPYGGGVGMLMRVDIIDKAVTNIKTDNSKVILLDTKGKFYNQQHAKKLAKTEHLILIAPHYEGVDHRVHQYIADEVYSIGPYILTGGELPTMILIDSIVRLIPEVINADSLIEESYNDPKQNNIEYPQYTRPEVYNTWKVPKILLSGHHTKIQEWKNKNTTSVKETSSAQ